MLPALSMGHAECGCRGLSGNFKGPLDWLKPPSPLGGRHVAGHGCPSRAGGLHLSGRILSLISLRLFRIHTLGGHDDGHNASGSQRGSGRT
jgi:hypothetical protein